MNIALVADWLPTYGGAEHVIAEFAKLFPKAPLYTTVAAHGKLGPLDSADIRTSRLQKWYHYIGNHQVLLPFMPRIIEDIDLREYDVILSSSHAVAKGVIPPSHSKHVCYCHTPMRYAWEMEDQYLQDFHIPKLLQKPIRKQLKHLRRWDMTTAKRVDTFIANSKETQERIQRIYNRDSIVINPPVDDRFFTVTPSTKTDQSYYLAIGRLVPYKRFDLLIELANLTKMTLKIAGTGQDEKRLRSLAGPTVEFLGFVPNEELPSLYASATALLFPQHEDAGVVPLEAQASGTPVIAYGKGGALDTVLEGSTGTFFTNQTVDSLRDALQAFNQISFERNKIQEHAKQFSSSMFQKKIKGVIEETYAS